MKNSIQECVFVLESPSPEDLLINRREGDALCASLTLSQVPVKYFQIGNKRALRLALKEIAKTPKSVTKVTGHGEVTESKVFVPMLHFSFHANEEGLALSSDEFLTWEEFLSMLTEFNDSYGWLSEGKSMVIVALSACSGFAVSKYARLLEKVPFKWLCGFVKPVSWADALVTYTAYYHLVIGKGLTGKEALKQASIASGLESGAFRAINGELKETRELINE